MRTAELDFGADSFDGAQRWLEISVNGTTLSPRNSVTRSPYAIQTRGMIAEEVGEILPEVVQYEDNGVDAIGMDYSRPTPLLVEAVNALRNECEHEIDAIRKQTNAQLAGKDAEIRLLTQRVEKLEAMVDRLIIEKRPGAIEKRPETAR